MTRQFEYEEHWVYHLDDLNDYGKRGWELICFSEFNKHLDGRTGTSAIFKREIASPTTVQNSDEPRRSS